MNGLGMQSRIQRLERAMSQSGCKEAVVLLANGHSRQEISSFLQNHGIQEGADQPIIIFQGRKPEGQAPNLPQRGLRFL